jgi:divalent metal cation (Fe/Co/Zn/Cd) transporter
MSTRAQSVVQGQRLEYLTLAWNGLEALVALVSGILAGSIALVSFGLDSVIEMSSGAALLWRLGNDRDPVYRERTEKTALRIVGACFVGLAAYVLADAVKTLITRERPSESMPGIAIAAAALIVMPLLARAKRRVATALSSGAMQADSRQSDLCAYLSAILLSGLVLNAALGWWWADPIAALIMAPIIAKEGVEALRGKTCACAPASPCCGTGAGAPFGNSCCATEANSKSEGDCAHPAS